MSTANCRTIRREVWRRLPKEEREQSSIGAIKLKEAIKYLEKIKRSFTLRGRPGGGYIISTNQLLGRTKVMSFRHPTKRVTAGRVAFLTVA